MFPINWIPLPPPADVQTPSGVPSYLSRTMTCFFGHVPVNATGGMLLAGDEACAASGGSAFVWFLVYLLFNVSFNVLLLWLTKRMSATWAQIA